MEPNDVFVQLDAKLDKIMRLLAVQVTAGLKVVPAIQALAAAGLERQVIADVLNTTPNTVSVVISTSRAKARKRPKPGKKVVP